MGLLDNLTQQQKLLAGGLGIGGTALYLMYKRAQTAGVAEGVAAANMNPYGGAPMPVGGGFNDEEAGISSNWPLVSNSGVSRVEITNPNAIGFPGPTQGGFNQPLPPTGTPFVPLPGTPPTVAAPAPVIDPVTGQKAYLDLGRKNYWRDNAVVLPDGTRIVRGQVSNRNWVNARINAGLGIPQYLFDRIYHRRRRRMTPTGISKAAPSTVPTTEPNPEAMPRVAF